MDVLTLLDQARAAQLEWRAEGDRLVIRGPRTADALAQRLGAAKGALLALLVARESEISWRHEAFRARMLAGGPVWVPRIRDTLLCDRAGYCALCGSSLPSDPAPRFRQCWACGRALTLALMGTRQEVDELTAALASPASPGQKQTRHRAAQESALEDI